MSDPKITVDRVAYNKNGINGAPYYSVLFHHYRKRDKFVAFVFGEDGHIVVSDINKLLLGQIGYEGNDERLYNSWKGECYEEQLQAAINRFNDEVQKELGI